MELALLVFQTVALLVIFTVVVVNVFSVRQLARQPASIGGPPVSLLIPARNEARNIEAAVMSAMNQTYVPLDVWVLDDVSDDETPLLIESLKKRFPHLNFLRGRQPPLGWLGKPYACHQLAEAAKGEILIFMDCDVRLAPEAVARTVGYLQQERLEFVSVFPHQDTVSWSEKLVVPLVSLILYGFLPFPWIRRSMSPAFSAASGQWMAIRAGTYRVVGGHGAVKNKVLEDIELTRCIRTLGRPMDVVSGVDTVFCRMYRNTREVIEGFSKNAFASAQYHLLNFLGFLAFFVTVFLLPFGLLYAPLAWLPVSLVVLIKLMLAVRFRHEPVSFILLHPLSVLFGLIIAVNSIRWYYAGCGHWKGRPV